MRYLILLMFPLFIFSCQTTESVQVQESDDKVINYDYQNVIFSPEYQDKNIKNHVLLTIRPIDATELNQITLNAAFRAGNYESEFADEYIEADLENMRSRDRDRAENKLKVTDDILSLIEKGELSPSLANELIEVMWHEEGGFDGSETEFFVGNRVTPAFNPFYIGSNYLSVFELEFENRSQEVKSLEFENFQITSGQELLVPFNIEYFEERFHSAQAKLLNAYRYNLTDHINLPPQQSVIKYISIPAVNNNTNSLSVQYIGESYYSFDYEIDVIRESKEINLLNYIVNIELSDLSSRDERFVDNFVAIDIGNSRQFTLKDKELFVTEFERNQPVNVCIATISRNIGELTCSEVNLNAHPNRNIPITISISD